MRTEFCLHECMGKTILHAQKSMHANIKFFEPCLIKKVKLCLLVTFIYVNDLIKKQELCLLERLNLGMLKLVCPKLV